MMKMRQAGGQTCPLFFCQMRLFPKEKEERNPMETIVSINSAINNFVWGIPAMVCIFG